MYTKARRLIPVITSTLALASPFAAFAKAQPSEKVDTAAPIPGYKLVWSDEFDGTKVNEDEWNYRLGVHRESYCTADNVSIEDGKLKIDLRVENVGGKKFTGGGVITKRQWHYGYYETRAKLDDGYGWHEAFWTTLSDGVWGTEDPQYQDTDRIEIDGFEHYAGHGPHEITYGIIEWHPLRGSISRDFYETESDLTKDFTVYGFEFTPDYINFYIEGNLVRTVDIRDVPQNPFHLWLTCIATKPPEAPGECFFDYMRCYEISEEDYAERRKLFLPELDAARNAWAPSQGIDLWVEAEDFEKYGTWNIGRDGTSRILVGIPNKPTPAEDAYTRIVVSNDGTYRAWVRARDFPGHNPGSRTFKMSINGQESPETFGNHGEEGFAWEDAGTFDLKAGMTDINLIDSSRFYGRVDRLLLTTDLAYIPEGEGGEANVEHRLW